MGAMAEALVAYSQPLIDGTDGSIEEMQKALAISQLCYNLAILPEESRKQSLEKMKLQLMLSDEDFEDFKREIILPMVHRHHEMFPPMHKSRQRDQPKSRITSPSVQKINTVFEEHRHTSIDRYTQCPCNSGRKYKFCCGKS